jgi:cholesterol oxidase
MMTLGSSEMPSVAPTVDQPARLVFAVASCQYPAGLADIEPAFASYRRLERRLVPGSNYSNPSFLLTMGDQVYVDATAGLFDPTRDGDRFETPYRRLRNILESDLDRRYKEVWDLLEFSRDWTMLDDHEIGDNWEPSINANSRDDCLLRNGVSAFLKYGRNGESSPSGDSRWGLWQRLEKSGIPFFIADTRTERDARTPQTLLSARIMGDTQWRELAEWLLVQHEQRPKTPKVIASPAILLPRHTETLGYPAHALRSDSWDGYPRSLNRMLAVIARHRIENVIFLSGDEHLSCLSRIELQRDSGTSVVAHSIHSSALYAPYPFANAVPEDLVGEDCFTVRDSEMSYACRVSTYFPDRGDGFAILTLDKKDTARWNLGVEFCGERGEVTKNIELC